MKRTNAIYSAIMASFLAMGIAGQASAMVANGPFGLDNGSSGAKGVGGTDHYTLQIDSPTRLHIISKSFVPMNSQHIHARASLLDDNGNVVSKAHQNGRHFSLDQVVQPGTYTLAVDSWNTSASKEGPNMYLLKTRMDPAR